MKPAHSQRSNPKGQTFSQLVLQGYSFEKRRALTLDNRLQRRNCTSIQGGGVARVDIPIGLTIFWGSRQDSGQNSERLKDRIDMSAWRSTRSRPAIRTARTIAPANFFQVRNAGFLIREFVKYGSDVQVFLCLMLHMNIEVFWPSSP